MAELNSDELILKFEEVSIEHAKLSREILIRKLNKKFTDEQLVVIHSINMNAASYVVDSIPSGVLSKKEFKNEIEKGIRDVVDKCIDENR